MKQSIYYAILSHRSFFTVKYTIVPECRILTFGGTFDTAVEAEQTFKQAVKGRLEQLSEGAFARKIEHLQACYRRDLAKLADWNIGRAIQR
jgi:hypothetical protein